MALTKYKLGKLLEHSDIRNDKLEYTLDDIKGISIQKIFIETKANMKGVSLSPYKLVKPNDFAYVTVTSRNGEKISLAHNITEKVYIVSSSYEVFRVKNHDLLLPDYLFMYFNRLEFDRFARFNSWGSARETFDWDEFCDMEIELPPISIQQKYVDVYNAMLENQKNYERGLDDLKLVCDAYIEGLRRQIPCEPIGKYIELVNEINSSYDINNVKGVESSGSFMKTRANMQGVDIGKYTVVRKGSIVYNPSRINLGSIVIYKDDSPCVVSPMYSIFKVSVTEKVIPEYLMLWFSRGEFQRYTNYYAVGSVRDTFDFNLMKEVKFPIPSIKIQKEIVNISTTYNTRKELNEKLKSQLKDICPILIKGSVEEGRRMKEA
ncbi:restriction endonuclease subunit S [Parvimonas micra]